jgi:hypothetical protein
VLFVAALFVEVLFVAALFVAALDVAAAFVLAAPKPAFVLPFELFSAIVLLISLFFLF